MKAFAGKNVTYENHVFDLAAETEAPVQTPFQPIPSDRWSDLLTSGKTEQLQIEVFAFLNQTKSSGTATREFLTGFYYQFLQLLFRQMDHPGSEDEAFRRQITVASRSRPSPRLVLYENGFPTVFCCSYKAVRQPLPGHGCCHRESIYRIAPLRRAGSRYACSHGIPERRLSVPSLQKDTGSSLINYVIDRRIARSKELLAKGEMSIRDIAITCGFQNISYFSRQFKNRRA